MGRRYAMMTLSLFALGATGCGSAKLASPAQPSSPAYAAESGYGQPGYGSPGAAPAYTATAPSMPAPPPGVSPADRSKAATVAGGAPSPTAKRAGSTPPRTVAIARTRGVRAGEWDDNANYREFQSYLETQRGVSYRRLDIRNRQFLVVRDVRGKAVPGCTVTVSDPHQRSTKLTTMASGRAILFPHAEGLRGTELVATASCQGAMATKKLTLSQTDNVVDLRLKKHRALPAKRSIDVVFILDSTGSMSEEIAAVKDTIKKVAATVRQLNVSVRVGLVEFKDRSDSFVTKVYPMTSNVTRFAKRVSQIYASGGGDMPESVNEGLSVALNRLKWNSRAVARLAFLIGDAPPHLDYQQDVSYTVSARKAARKGIQLYTIAASGMNGLGQVVWRQLAQYTGGTNMFVLRGGAGPQSTGAGDPRSSCGGTQTNYTSGNLDQLIVRKIRRAVKDVERNPMRIAGLQTDENAKPCDQRLVIAQ